ncbi:MAG: 1-acyl-sn-glycerol-3-phosphate acyltransferase [Candidatus Obscuribacterales bacterium]|nr:1-acyl-sn-glycerol-3-phosphate acyltransferase [Candidatus Obscuribacterales bacterium]
MDSHLYLASDERTARRAFVAANFLSQTADKLAMLSLFSVIILFGPQGELLGLSSCLLLVPCILFSFPAGILADKFSPFRLLNRSLLFRAAILLGLSMTLPQILDEVQRCLIVGMLMVALSSASAVFDICRLKVTPKVVKLSTDGNEKENALAPLVRLNSLFWASLAAAIMSSSLLWLATGTEFPWTLLRVCVVLYVLAYLAGSKVEDICAAAYRRKDTPPQMSFWQYLKRHKRAAKTLFVSAGVGTFSLAFFVCLTLFAWQGHRLSLPLMTELLPALSLGLMCGGLAANHTVRSGGLTKLTEGLAIVLAVSSVAAVVTASTGKLIVAQLGVFALGYTASKSQSLLDTLCQSIFPRQYRGRALGLRAGLQLLPLLFAAIYMERILPSVSLLPALRVLSITALVFALLMAFVWNDLLFLLCRLFARALLKVFFHFQVIDKSHPDDATASGVKEWGRKRTVILAGNHTGWLDPLIVGAIFERRTRFLIMDEAMKWPVVGQMAATLGAIPLKRGHGLDALKSAQACLSRGESVLIFPEGKLTRDGSIGEFQPGVARLQKEAQCAIVPFAISGGYEAWPREKRAPRPASIRIAIGRPLEANELQDLSVDEIRHLLHDRVLELKSNA